MVTTQLSYWHTILQMVRINIIKLTLAIFTTWHRIKSLSEQVQYQWHIWHLYLGNLADVLIQSAYIFIHQAAYMTTFPWRPQAVWLLLHLIDSTTLTCFHFMRHAISQLWFFFCGNLWRDVTCAWIWQICLVLNSNLRVNVHESECAWAVCLGYSNN